MESWSRTWVWAVAFVGWVGLSGSASANVPKNKRFQSPAAKWAWQTPDKFSELSPKLQKLLRTGKIKVTLAYRKNEKNKTMLVTMVRGIIKKSPKAVFKTMAQIEKAHTFMPRMFYSKIKKKVGPHKFHVLRKLKVAWVKLKLNVLVELIPHRRYQFRLLTNLKNDIKDSIGAMTFEPINGGKHTLLTYCSYADSGRWVPGFIRKSILRRDLPGVLLAIRKRTMSNYTWKK